ncbi:MAG TPA: response regulator transcription factor [Bryobacteraceae bacterium]|nr:response regulator transcription factor [Bryobacteraceae bacterium]
MAPVTVAKRAKLLLADDHALVAAGLAKLLQEDFDLVATTCNGREVLETIERSRPEVVVLDISMPELNGLETARRLRKTAPGIKIVFITVHSDLAYAAAAFRAGASGFVLKGSAVSELGAAINAVLRGETFLTSLVDRESLDAVLQQPEQRSPLTRRQQEVLQLVAEGHSAKDIGDNLNISSKTVEFHKSLIMKRLNLHSVAQLTRYAIEHGIANSN